ncbi:hypothetical protein UP06_14435 [Bradyrhizobium sp. LTSP857]|nr:hypothetical protein UP06_14435 [Bradyrhizobium sp. LTSP857]
MTPQKDDYNDSPLVFERVVRPIALPSWDVDDYLRSDGTVRQVLTAWTTTVISLEVPQPDGFQCFHRCQAAEGSTRQMELVILQIRYSQ